MFLMDRRGYFIAKTLAVICCIKKGWNRRSVRFTNHPAEFLALAPMIAVFDSGRGTASKVMKVPEVTGVQEFERRDVFIQARQSS